MNHFVWHKICLTSQRSLTQQRCCYFNRISSSSSLEDVTCNAGPKGPAFCIPGKGLSIVMPPTAATVRFVKTSSSKPSVGCNRAGFTFVDAAGNLVQIYWEDLQSRGEGLFVFDGSAWRRVRNVSALLRRSDGSQSFRFAIAPLGSDEASLRAASIKIPSGLLQGDGVDQVSRVRELLALPRSLVVDSELWGSLDPEERRVVDSLRDHTGLSDAAILTALRSGGDVSAGSFKDAAREACANSSRVAVGRDFLRYGSDNVIAAALAGGKVDVEDFVSLFSASSARTFGVRQFGVNGSLADDLVELLVEFSGAPDPVAAALAGVYRLAPAPRAEMLLAFDILSNGAVDPVVASRIASDLVARGMHAPEVVDLVTLHLMRSGGDEQGVETLLSEYLADPTGTVRRRGSADVVLAGKLPELSASERVAMLSLLGLPPSTVPTETDLDVLDILDPDLFLRVQALVADATGAEHPGNVDYVVRAIAVFGDRAPEWLLKNASCPSLDRARMLERLPDADTAALRVRQLAEVLSAPEPTPEERAAAIVATETLGSLSASLRVRERGEFLRSLGSALTEDPTSAAKALRAVSDPEELLGLCANPDQLTLRLESLGTDDAALDLRRSLGAIADLLRSDRAAAASAVRKFLAAGGDPAMLLASSADELKAEGGQLLEGSVSDATRALLVMTEPGMLLGLLPSAAAANKRLKALGSGPEADFLRRYSELLKGGDASAAEEFARESLGDPRLAGVLLPTAKVASQRLTDLKPLLETSQERAARLDGIRRDFELWSRYADAFVAGDEDTLIGVGSEIFPDKEQGRLSVHDALYWLPSDPRSTVSSDGTTLGSWLLDADRGSSALRTETGRRSLSAAAGAWASHGSSSAVIKDLADAVLAREFGGYQDDLSLFFVRSKISKSSAQQSVTALRSSRETPTILPLDAVFEDPATGVRGYFLPRTDPRGMQAGVFTDCCQHPASAGASCALAGQTQPSSGFFVVEDASGAIIAQSWVWAADGANGSPPGVIFDNIEARLAGADAARVASVRQVYDSAADALSERFDRVLIGYGNDVPTDDLPPLPPEENLLAASIGYSGYLGDSQRQRLYRSRSGSGPRFLGIEGGFRVEEGSSSVVVRADGSVELSGPGARDLAERALATSTLREYRIVDDSGAETGEVFSAGVLSAHAMSVDLDSAPVSYDRFSDEVLKRTSQLTGLPDEDCATWLRLASGDPDLAARTHASGISAEEFLYVGHQLRSIGRLPVFPPGLSGAAEPGSPEAVLRAGFLRFWSNDPVVAERAFSSPVITEVITDVLDVAADTSRDKLLVETVAGSFPMLAGRSREERINLLKGMVGVQSDASKAGHSLDVGQVTLLRAVEDCVAREISPFEMEALAALAPRFGVRSGAALTDASSRERFGALSWEERDTVRSVVDHVFRDISYLRPDLDTALVFAAEKDASLRYAATRNNPTSHDPKETLKFLQEVPFTEDSPLEEVRQFCESFGDAPDSYEASSARSEAIGAVARRYRAAHRYVFDRAESAPLTTEETLELLAVDFDDLMSKCSDLGLSISSGENIMPYSFPARSIPVLAATSREELQSVASVVALERRYGSDLAAAVESGLTHEHLAAITPEGDEPELFDSYVLDGALRSGVTPEEIRSLARPGVDHTMFHALLGSSRLRRAFLSAEDPELTSLLLSTGFDEETVSFVFDLVGRNSSVRGEVLELLRPTGDGDDPSPRRGRDIFSRLAELGGVAQRLGGFRSSLQPPPV